MTDEEKKAIDNLKNFKSIKILYGNTFTMFLEQLKKYQEATDIILKLTKKQQEQLEDIKEYTHQEIVHYSEDIRDYIDDDKERNKQIIGELKEDREHWKDIEKILQNKPKEELYMNWWEVGLYE